MDDDITLLLIVMDSLLRLIASTISTRLESRKNLTWPEALVGTAEALEHGRKQRRELKTEQTLAF